MDLNRWKWILVTIEVIWIMILISACVAVIQVITACAATPYIDARTGEWVICEISSQDNAIDITEPPPINDVSVVLDEVDANGHKLEYLGEFTLTYYCSCGRCNGYDKYGNPRSYDRYGNPLIWGTVAVDPKVIPMHTRLVVDGYDAIFEARDIGSGVDGRHIDIYVPVSHSEALRMGQGERRQVWKYIE